MPGYDLSRFDSTIEQDFVCSICLCVFLNPVQDKCEHLFCADCIHDWLTKNDSSNGKGRCPLCQETIVWTEMKPASRIVKNLLSNLKINCKFREYGCIQSIKYDLIADHEKDCKHQLCPKGCGATLNNLQDHDCISFLKYTVQELTQDLVTLQTICELNQKEIDELKNISHNSISLLDANVPFIEKGINQIESTIKSAHITINDRKKIKSTEIMYIYTNVKRFSKRAICDHLKSILPAELRQDRKIMEPILRGENLEEFTKDASRFGVFKLIIDKQLFKLIAQPNMWPPHTHCVVPGHLIRGFQGERSN